MQKEKRHGECQGSDDERKGRNKKKRYDRNLPDLRHQDVQDNGESEIDLTFLKVNPELLSRFWVNFLLDYEIETCFLDIRHFGSLERILWYCCF
jgi:hypothetical protein